MIEIHNLNKSEPYIKFQELYNLALNAKQASVDAMVISSFNTHQHEVESRFVNLKYINNNEWTFFSNYLSKKAEDFHSHNQISALLHWPSIKIQIRIKAKIRKSNAKLSDTHFHNRSDVKNALSISSKQSNPIDSYDSVIKNYEKTLNNSNQLKKRPKFWGGYSFIPYYFEFWEGHESRINKRETFYKENQNWIFSILEP
jgi:pyridoxamine 5'-phosphate oxidase